MSNTTRSHVHGDACCKNGHDCTSHGRTHAHGPACGHRAVEHGDHLDYLVDGHLHHPCMGHCDDHGVIA